MKIRPTQSTQQVVAPERDGGRRPADVQAPAAHPAAQVQRSAFARALETAAGPAQVRADLVAEVRAQLAAGTFEDSVDMDGVVDSLLADL